MLKEDFIRRADEEGSARFYSGVTELRDANGEPTGEEEVLWTYPSNTTVLDASYPMDSYLIKWIRENGLQGQAIFEKAAEEGTAVHVAIENLLLGKALQSFEFSSKEKKCIQAFIDWYDEFKPKIISTEHIVVNHEFKYAGTLDLVCELDYTKGKTVYKGRFIVDYKTSTSVQPKHKLQVSAYQQAEDPTAQTAILHLGNRTKAKWSFLPFDPAPQWEGFKLFKQVFEFMQPDAQPKIIEYTETFTLNGKTNEM